MILIFIPDHFIKRPDHFIKRLDYFIKRLDYIIKMLDHIFKCLDTTFEGLDTTFDGLDTTFDGLDTCAGAAAFVQIRGLMAGKTEETLPSTGGGFFYLHKIKSLYLCYL